MSTKTPKNYSSKLAADTQSASIRISDQFVDPSRFDAQLADYVPKQPILDFSDPHRSRIEGLEAFRNRKVEVPEEARLEITDQFVPGLRVGDPVVSVRIYRPKASGPLPAILWIHGGSFIRGAVESDHPRVAGLADATSAVVISVDYRLAPQHPYPAAIDDCEAALRWLSEQDASFVSDKIVVAGISAGGALAASLAIRARNNGGPALCLQALLMPMIDDRSVTQSMTEFTDPRIYNAELARAGWRNYLSSKNLKGSEIPSDASPGRAADLHRLPPAYVCVAELDPLRDEGVEYAMRLARAGVPVDLHQFPGAFHGSQFAIPHARVSQRMRAELYDVITRSFVSSHSSAAAI